MGSGIALRPLCPHNNKQTPAQGCGVQSTKHISIPLASALKNSSLPARIIAMNALGQCVYDGPYRETMGAGWTTGVYRIAVIGGRGRAVLSVV